MLLDDTLLTNRDFSYLNNNNVVNHTHVLPFIIKIKVNFRKLSVIIGIKVKVLKCFNFFIILMAVPVHYNRKAI